MANSRKTRKDNLKKATKAVKSGAAGKKPKTNIGLHWKSSKLATKLNKQSTAARKKKK